MIMSDKNGEENPYMSCDYCNYSPITKIKAVENSTGHKLVVYECPQCGESTTRLQIDENSKKNPQ
ncbi:hypothetical protein ACG2LH_08060 [Zhouia sp. PK063]|uniref:hypothetical protein n=1 Tax=Zhouia sp. PK063 TaxID=3373602 RepID=UPI0037B4376C